MLFLFILVTILILDMIWLGLIAKNIYAQEIGMLMRKSGEKTDFVLWSAFLVYLLIALGILFFVLPKANGDYYLALIWGGVFGLIMYGIYDFTNYSILANWSLRISIIDLLWGMVLCGLSSFFATILQNRIYA